MLGNLFRLSCLCFIPGKESGFRKGLPTPEGTYVSPVLGS